MINSFPSSAADESPSNRRLVGAPWFIAADRVGVASSHSVLRAVKRFGLSGTGKRIADLAGVVADRAARSRLGNGPVKMGGSGIKGGDRVLAVIRFAPLVVVGIAAVAELIHAAGEATDAEPVA